LRGCRHAAERQRREQRRAQIQGPESANHWSQVTPVQFHSKVILEAFLQGDYDQCGTLFLSLP
jgi:hypothetical protein